MTIDIITFTITMIILIVMVVFLITHKQKGYIMHTKKPKLNIIIWEKGYSKQYSDTNYHNLDKNTLDKHLQLSIEFSGGGNDGMSNCSFKINLKQFMNFYRLKNFQ